MFYVKPPNGQIPLHVMEKCVHTRLEYLEYLYTNEANDFEGNFQYLLENSAYDKVGHFILRLIASTSADLWMYWLPRETLLLKHRLDNITPRQLNNLFRSIIRQLDTIESIENEISLNIRRLCLFYLKSTVFKHIMSKNHANDCCVFQFKVRFELIPELIKHREVDLTAGYAVIYCSQWKKLLVALFNTYLISDLKHIKTHAWHVNNDVRLQSLKQQVQFYISPNRSTIGRVNNNNINVEVEKFPLCMQHLHKVLKKRYRLSHYARFYYSLFLKEGGMKIDDAIRYWKEEYSKPHTCTSVCTHNWQTDEKKFVYSIRHLYGLEGSRRNYKSPSCTVMCAQVPGAAYEGGCPFKHFDSDKLINLLSSSLTKDKIDQFLQIMPSQKPEILCSSYFKLVHKNYDDNVIINSPIQYYAMANN
ncbi:PREDICTED: DNA primase large subunit-like [Polistes dominula]|uniref:DNA primase large subunit-like n=1 Tax=Polistes dominula TaxID=743375 RepID=A0ABM1I4C5_POLDO|nr:PREDICTED: DNA primase large subunit-like [Polistes dominula]